MDRRLALRHLTASKANQVEEFPLKFFKEITIGRDPLCEVKYDPDQEDLISRRHAQIVVQDAEKGEFQISDLGSRNGTFVNKQRIFGPVRLNPGDVVQLGAGGPEFQFDVEPPLELGIKPTRLAAAAAAGGLPATRDAVVATGQPAPSATVGRATVERLIADTKTQSRKHLLIGGIVVLVACIAIIAGVLMFRKPAPPVVINNPPPGSGSLTPTQIAQAYTDAVVFIEAGWKLVSTESGRQLNHAYVSNRAKDSKGNDVRRWPVDIDNLPVFVLLGNKIEPLLTTDDGKGQNKAIGGRHSGSGFVVSSDGFVLTNRHVAASWHTVYGWHDRAGLLVVFDDNLKVKQAVPIPSSKFPNWVPSNAKFVVEGDFDPDKVRVLSKWDATSGKDLEGRNDYLDVTFAKNRIRIPSKIARVSDRADVAMIKVEIPQSLHKLELNDNWDAVKVGDPAIAMGYPGVSPDVVGKTGSSDPLNSEDALKVIPDPTLSAGNIGRVIRGQAGLTEATISTFGDVYQLTINSTGHGNSGGPVFDDRGRVIGIFTYGFTPIGDAAITFAVPIRYGMELMGVVKPGR